MVRETTHATGMTLCTHWSQVAAQHLFATPCLSQSNTSESGNMLLRQSYFERAEGETLLSVLRNRLNLTGTKYGCREGQCGACTVLIERRATRCCQVLASATAGKKISTIEGLATGGKLRHWPQPSRVLLPQPGKGPRCEVRLCSRSTIAAGPHRSGDWERLLSR